MTARGGSSPSYFEPMREVGTERRPGRPSYLCWASWMVIDVPMAYVLLGCDQNTVSGSVGSCAESYDHGNLRTVDHRLYRFSCFTLLDTVRQSAHRASGSEGWIRWVAGTPPGAKWVPGMYRRSIDVGRCEWRVMWCGQRAN